MRSWLSSRAGEMLSERRGARVVLDADGDRELFRQVPGERCAVPAGHARRGDEVAGEGGDRTGDGDGAGEDSARRMLVDQLAPGRGECGDARGVPLGDVHPMLANPLQPSVGRGEPHAHVAAPELGDQPCRIVRGRLQARRAATAGGGPVFALAHETGLDQAAHEGGGGRRRDAEPLAQLGARGRRSRDDQCECLLLRIARARGPRALSRRLGRGWRRGLGSHGSS